MSAGRTLRLAGDVDVAAAAREARGLAEACGLSGVEAQHVATAVSEVARNAVRYARGGEVELAAGRARRPARPGGHGARRRARASPTSALALRDGVSTGGSLGLGLPGARRLMDDFTIRSGPDGTVVTMARWEGGLLADHVPAVCALHDGPGGVPVAQPFRNGLLLGIAAGAARGRASCARWRTRPWHAPAAARRRLPRGARGGRAARPRRGERERARRAADVAARRRGGLRAAARASGDALRSRRRGPGR